MTAVVVFSFVGAMAAFLLLLPVDARIMGWSEAWKKNRRNMLIVWLLNVLLYGSLYLMR